MLNTKHYQIYQSEKKRELNSHKERVHNNRLPKIARDEKPKGVPPVRRSQRRWTESWI